MKKNEKAISTDELISEQVVEKDSSLERSFDKVVIRSGIFRRATDKVVSNRGFCCVNRWRRSDSFLSNQVI